MGDTSPSQDTRVSLVCNFRLYKFTYTVVCIGIGCVGFPQPPKYCKKKKKSICEVRCDAAHEAGSQVKQRKIKDKF